MTTLNSQKQKLTDAKEVERANQFPRKEENERKPAEAVSGKVEEDKRGSDIIPKVVRQRKWKKSSKKDK